MGGSPMRAIAVLSFLLLPPLQSRHTHSLPTTNTSLYLVRERVDSPVLPTLSVPILCQVQLVDGGGDHISDARLWNTSQSGKHGQQLSPCHPLYQSIKLRTVANLLLDLRPTFIHFNIYPLLSPTADSCNTNFPRRIFFCSTWHAQPFFSNQLQCNMYNGRVCVTAPVADGVNNAPFRWLRGLSFCWPILLASYQCVLPNINTISFLLTLFMSVLMSQPETNAVPLDGVMSPVNIPNGEVFPAPV